MNGKPKEWKGLEVALWIQPMLQPPTHRFGLRVSPPLFSRNIALRQKDFASSSESDMGASVGKSEVSQLKPAITEAALLLVLEKFFDVVLNLPGVNRRLSDVLGLLSHEQPTCPQLYICSSADRVIPANSMESFIEKQKRTGRATSSLHHMLIILKMIHICIQVSSASFWRTVCSLVANIHKDIEALIITTFF